MPEDVGFNLLALFLCVVTLQVNSVFSKLNQLNVTDMGFCSHHDFVPELHGNT